MGKLKYWIALDREHGMGPAHLIELYNKLSASNLSISDLFDLSADEMVSELNVNRVTAAAIASAKGRLSLTEDDYIRVIDSGISVIPFYAENYPSRLARLLGNAIPPFLYALGNPSILSESGIAVLGDRGASSKGMTIAYHAARELSRHRISVVSGMAAGIGLTAHRGALENSGVTAAVIPGGIFGFKLPAELMDSFDPDRIVFVSPFYPSAEFNTFNAYVRNRIICALSKGVFIVEAPEKEGIFEAAKSAHKLKLPIFTAEYAEYPASAAGNRIIIENWGGIPIRGKIENEVHVPNIEKIIAAAKFSD